MEHFKNIVWIIAKLVLVYFFSIMVSLLIGIPIGLIIFELSEAGRELSVENEMFINIIIGNLAMIIGIFIVYKIFEKRSNLSIGWKDDDLVNKGIEGSLWGIFLITIPFLFVLLLGGIQILSVGFNLAVLKNLAIGVLLFLLVAISEELLVRGYIQGLIKQKYGVKAAIIAGSLIFALLHIFNPNILQSPIPLIVLFIAGILFGVSREVTGSLWVPIGIHFTWNLFQGHIYGFEVSGGEFGPTVFEIERIGHQLINGGPFGLEGSIVTTIFLILAIYLHYWVYVEWKRKKKGQ
ncbi:CPBP family intramembrane glutamic endopeptidase [Natronospora cellulosivora (SeqCode)]